MKNNSHVYGANVHFSWDVGFPDIVRSQHVPFTFPFQNTERRTPVISLLQDVIIVQGKYDTTKLNIYFGGWITSTPNLNLKPLGLTTDPADGAFGLVIINDRGWNSPFSVQVLLDEHVLEHEIGHFLLRRLTDPDYDAFEHVPDGSDNLMDEFVEYPLQLPKDEQEEIGNRIRSGNWNIP